ncbi:amidohydrolase family protein [Mumia sp. DW29H23]|uniref:amidohydrolase family protein n=1 Tax=Mumia sp. DW29H23 TaxID=3421241 RepID=UPI003D691C87
MTVIDTHLHLWDLEAGEYAWLGPQHGPLNRTFGAAEAGAELAAAGVDGAVLVQAEDSEADTRAMLRCADAASYVVGVVGWIALEEPSLAQRQLDDYGARPAFRGVRHLVHDDPRDDFLELPGVRASLATLAERGLTFDVPDAWPRHLSRLPDLLDSVPDLTVVVDHLGKPPRGTPDLATWESCLREVARRPRAVAKVSGLQMPGQPFTVDALRPVWEIALDAFGPARLMYGGDWPMTVPDGGYLPHWEVVRTLVGELSADEQDRVLAGTARAVYGVDV